MNDLVKIEQFHLEGVLQAPVDAHPVAVYLAGLAPSGRRAMAARLNRVCEYCGMQAPFDLDFEREQKRYRIMHFPWHQLRYEHVVGIKHRMMDEDKAPATINATLSAIRGVARECFNLKLTDADDYQRLRSVKSVRGERLPAGRSLSGGELRALFETCGKDGSPAGARDAAILAALYGAGLRRQEVIDLSLGDFDPERDQLKVLGKGNKQRMAYVSNGASSALKAWIKIRGQESGSLFCPVTRGRKLVRRKMTDQAVYNAVLKRCKEAGVKPCSPHDLRRSFVSDLLDVGADISTVQRLVGHASVNTTSRYDRRGEKVKQKAIQLLHVPYFTNAATA